MSENKQTINSVTFPLCSGGTITIDASNVTEIARDLSEHDVKTFVQYAGGAHWVREPFKVVLSKLVLAGTPAVDLPADGTIPIYSQHGCHIGCASRAGSFGSFEQNEPYVHPGNLNEEQLREWLITLTFNLSEKSKRETGLNALTEEYDNDIAAYKRDIEETTKLIANCLCPKNLFVYSPNNEKKEPATIKILPFSKSGAHAGKIIYFSDEPNKETKAEDTKQTLSPPERLLLVDAIANALFQAVREINKPILANDFNQVVASVREMFIRGKA